MLYFNKTDSNTYLILIKLLKTENYVSADSIKTRTLEYGIHPHPTDTSEIKYSVQQNV
jgi:hypothetical protein